VFEGGVFVHKYIRLVYKRKPKNPKLTYSNPYQGHPCHIEIFLSTPSAEVARSKDLDAPSSKKAKTVQAIEA